MEGPVKTKKDHYRDPKHRSLRSLSLSDSGTGARRKDRYDEDDDNESHLSNLTNSPAPEVEDDPPVIHPVVKREAGTQSVLTGSTHTKKTFGTNISETMPKSLPNIGIQRSPSSSPGASGGAKRRPPAAWRPLRRLPPSRGPH